MTCLVTGGTGMVGRHLQEIMPDAIYLGSADCNLADDGAVEVFFQKHKPESVIHLAAKVGGIMQNISSPADFFDANIKMNSNVLIAAKRHGVKNFLAILSTCMYPDVADTYPLTEEDIHKGPPAPA